MFDLKAEIKQYEHAEEEFFDIDREAKLAHIKLSFARPSEIFDVNYISKTPILSDDFLDWIGSAFDLIPARYKIDLEVSFQDLEGWNEEALLDNFKKNIMLEYKSTLAKQRKKSHIAYALMSIGLVMFVAMMLINGLWNVSSVLKDIFLYVSDIAATVAFWEALTILVVERSESGFARTSLVHRFASIKFRKGDDV